MSTASGVDPPVDLATLMFETVINQGAGLGAVVAPLMRTTPQPKPTAPPPSADGIVAVHYHALDPASLTVDPSGPVVGDGGGATVRPVVVHDNGGGNRLDPSARYVIKQLPPPHLPDWASRRLRQEVAVSRMLAGIPTVHAAAGGVHGLGLNGIVMPRADDTLGVRAALRGAGRGRSGVA